MRIAFLGNGPFAVPSLRKLAEIGHDVALVVARPDLPQGKHLQAERGPVALEAAELGLPLEQPADVNADHFVASLGGLGLDLLVVADFGQILKPQCLATARLGGINIHGSLLPAYRGAAPIAWAILRGEARTGVSIIQMTERLDAGAVILQQSIGIARNWTAGDLENKLSEVGADLMERAIGLLVDGAATPITQDERKASRAPKLKKEDGAIDWSQPAADIYDRIRAMQPWPIAYSTLERPGRPPLRMQILLAEDPLSATTTEFSIDLQRRPKFAPGDIVETGATLDVQTGNGVLRILEIKSAGKSALDVPTFLRGNPTPPGSKFVDPAKIAAHETGG